MKYDLIVIGSGIGGSVCAAVAAAQGLKVLVLEKNPRPGGSCSYYEKDGYTVDIGTHMFSRGDKGPIGRIVRRLHWPRPVEFVTTPTIARLKGLGIDLALPSSPYRIPVFLARLVRQLHIAPHELPGVVRLFRDILTMPAHEIDDWNDRTVEEFIRRYTGNPWLHTFLSFLLGLYFILPAWEASAGESIWCLQHFFRDWSLSYPKGGAFRVPGTFLDIARHSGARLITDARVVRIDVRDGRACGVRLADGARLKGRTVASTTSLRTCVLDLVGPEHFPRPYVRRVRGIKSSSIAVQAKIALRRKLVRPGCLVGGTPLRISRRDLGSDYLSRTFRSFDQGKVPVMVPIYCPVPTNFDPCLAPPGRQLLTACSLAPTTDIPLVDPPERWTGAMLAALRAMIPGLDRHMEWCETFSVEDVEEWIGKAGGPAISTGQVPGQVGRNRPGITTPVPGLYAAGDCAGGRGIGTELAAASGEACADRIVEDIRNYIV